MAKEIIEIDRKKYLRIGDKLVEIDRFDANGKLVLKAWSEETKREDGSTDVTVHIPCLQIATKTD
ncbi:MAG: hypothetical protein ACETVZ_00100 [Phycisphaerae bacterium]